MNLRYSILLATPIWYVSAVKIPLYTIYSCVVLLSMKQKHMFILISHILVYSFSLKKSVKGLKRQKHISDVIISTLVTVYMDYVLCMYVCIFICMHIQCLGEARSLIHIVTIRECK